MAFRPSYRRSPPESVNPYPETLEEIAVYKEYLIQRQHERVGRPERRVAISTLKELSEYAGESGVLVKMEPGTYDVTLDNFKDFLGYSEQGGPRGGPYLFNFSGEKSIFDLRGVNIRIDTRILHSYAEPLGIDGGEVGIAQLLVEGNNLIIRGLTVENVHEIRPAGPEPEVRVTEVKTSGAEHEVFKTFDGNSTTLFGLGKGEGWVEYQLNRATALSSVSLQTRKDRVLPFEIQAAPGDDDSWRTVYEGEMTDDLESYEFDEVEADRVRIIGYGDQRGYSSVRQVRIGDLPWPNAYPESEGHHPSRYATLFSVAGDENLLKDISVTSRGSRPYGYGRLLGKGGGALVPMNKHSTVGGGKNNVFIGLEIYSRSYGHALGMSGSPVFIDCLIEGEIRSTDDMLEETSGPAYEVDFKNRWTGEKIRPGMMVSLQEDSFRTYRDTISGKLLGCTVRNTSSGTALGHAEGDVFISHHTAVGNTQRGLDIVSGGRIVNSRADIRYAPALDISSDDTEIELTILPSPVPDTVTRHRVGGPEDYTRQAARIAGRGHNIVLKAEGDPQVGEPTPIVIGQAREAGAREITLRNETGLPIFLTEDARDCEIFTDGEVIDRGEGNRIRRLR